MNLSRIFLVLAATLAACAAAHSAIAHEGHGEHGRSMGGGAGKEAAEQNASAAFDARGVLWAVHGDSGRIAVSRSEDLGRSWRKPVRVTAAIEATDSGGDARPKIAVGAGGELYVTWTRPLARPYTGEIRFSRSVDGGASFSAPLVVHADRQQITHRFDSIAVNAKGQVFVAWIDKRDQERLGANAKTYRGAAVYWAVSDDRGASFRGDFKLADYSCECCRIALLPREDGGVYAFWRHVFEPNIRDHALGEITARGAAGKVVRATFDDWRVDACPHHGASLAQDAGGQLHAVWFTGAPGKSGVYYGRLREGAVDGQRRVGGQTAEHADLSAIGNKLAIAWKEFDGERSRLRAARSDDAGRTWRESELAATDSPSGQPFVLAHDGTFYVFWNRRDAPLSVVTLP
ncbi:MAG TPA: sialidase family protein [Burkholderiales bacterium]|nr:sialidase family protein [Burkholderiales bacterium]